MTCMHWKLIAANCLIFSSLLVAPLATRAADAQSITQSNSIHAAITSAAPTDANFLQWANDIDGQYIAWAEQSPTDSVHPQSMGDQPRQHFQPMDGPLGTSR